ncbi:hypothetical protein [Promicromonospora umidemergens]|nr:hypothetical protein [Promicromonospora umidemergens]
MRRPYGNRTTWRRAPSRVGSSPWWCSRPSAYRWPRWPTAPTSEKRREEKQWARDRALLDAGRLDRWPVPESIGDGTATDGTIVEEASSYVVVSYTVEHRGWFDASTGEFESICFHFPYVDPDTFREVICP